MNKLTQLAEESLKTYNSGARLTEPEAIYFRNSVRMLDFDICYRILRTAKERFELTQTKDTQ